jgi:hypothetical protein
MGLAVLVSSPEPAGRLSKPAALADHFLFLHDRDALRRSLLASSLSPNGDEQSTSQQPNRRKTEPKSPAKPLPNVRAWLPALPGSGSFALTPRSSLPLVSLGAAGALRCLRQIPTASTASGWRPPFVARRLLLRIVGDQNSRGVGSTPLLPLFFRVIHDPDRGRPVMAGFRFLLFRSLGGDCQAGGPFLRDAFQRGRRGPAFPFSSVASS